MTTWTKESKTGSAGQGWLAGQSDITAGIRYDVTTGNQVFAGYIGQSVTWTNINKSS